MWLGRMGVIAFRSLSLCSLLPNSWSLDIVVLADSGEKVVGVRPSPGDDTPRPIGML